MFSLFLPQNPPHATMRMPRFCNRYTHATLTRTGDLRYTRYVALACNQEWFGLAMPGMPKSAPREGALALCVSYIMILVRPLLAPC